MSIFEFKHFTIKQEVAAVKVGTDAMLLGAFTSVDNATRVLEIGTGTGVISLMLAQKKRSLSIEALEIDEDTALEAFHNVQFSDFYSQIKVYPTDFLHFQTTKKYELIVSNPPYFENGLLPENIKVKIAKHITETIMCLWFEKIADLLSETGECWLIIPFRSLDSWEFLANSNNLFLINKIILHAKPGVIKRVIVTFSKIQKTVDEINFHVRNQLGEYTKEYILLTRDYHDRIPIR